MDLKDCGSRSIVARLDTVIASFCQYRWDNCVQGSELRVFENCFHFLKNKFRDGCLRGQAIPSWGLWIKYFLPGQLTGFCWDQASKQIISFIHQVKQ